MVRRYRRAAIPTVHDVAEIPTVENERGIENGYVRGLDTLVGFPTIPPDADAAAPTPTPGSR